MAIKAGKTIVQRMEGYHTLGRVVSNFVRQHHKISGTDIMSMASDDLYLGSVDVLNLKHFTIGMLGVESDTPGEHYGFGSRVSKIEFRNVKTRVHLARVIKNITNYDLKYCLLLASYTLGFMGK